MRGVVAVMVVLAVAGLVVAQPRNTNTSLALGLFCGSNQAMSPTSFSSNLVSTFSQLRSQLSKNRVYYARAESLENADGVYGIALCRNYLSTTQCVSCFDEAVSAIQPCGSANGANVYLDGCFLRYENYNQYIEDPESAGDANAPPPGVCGNVSTSQPSFRQAVQKLLSDIRVAAPRTSDFYVASISHETNGNATAYAVGQCVRNGSASFCNNCLTTASNSLYRCLPVEDGRSINLGCFMRYSKFPFFLDNQTTNITPFLGEGSSSSPPGIIIGVSSGVGLFLLILAFSLWYRRRRISSAAEEDTSDLKGARSYCYKDLKTGTNNFSDDNLIGEGGYGKVFKAVVDGGMIMAVKKIQIKGRAKNDFENEVKLLSNVRHRNLIQQLGWCIDGNELLLVLEYVSHGSLDNFLWGEKRGTLNWKQRSDIIFGIARGLAHLHGECHVKIIHRDIKSSNILLDNDFQPKIADFGLARFQPEDQTHVSTRFAGTMGYTAPEYATRGHLSDKVDAYSFGIVALEVISGRRCSDVNYSGPRMEYLLDQAWELYEKGVHVKLIDEAIDPNEYEEQNVMKSIEVALMCTQSPASLRPTMSEVILMLSNGPTVGQRQISRPNFIDADRRIHIGEN